MMDGINSNLDIDVETEKIKFSNLQGNENTGNGFDASNESSSNHSAIHIRNGNSQRSTSTLDNTLEAASSSGSASLDFMLNDELFFSFDDDIGSSSYDISNSALDYLSAMPQQQKQELNQGFNHLTEQPYLVPSFLNNSNLPKNHADGPSQQRTSLPSLLESEDTLPAIDGRESTLDWHNEELDNQQRLSMITVMYVASPLSIIVGCRFSFVVILFL
jgi:hypothetical protein